MTEIRKTNAIPSRGAAGSRILVKRHYPPIHVRNLRRRKGNVKRKDASGRKENAKEDGRMF
jgi:hypothetical protein